LFAYKWKNWKMHFIELDSMFGAGAKLNMQKLYKLIEDPKELYSVETVDVSAACVFPVMLKKVVEFKGTLVAEPRIRLGNPDPYVPAK
jgi:arylsulfatase